MLARVIEVVLDYGQGVVAVETDTPCTFEELDEIQTVSRAPAIPQTSENDEPYKTVAVEVLQSHGGRIFRSPNGNLAIAFPLAATKQLWRLGDWVFYSKYLP